MHVLPLLGQIQRRLDEDVSLGALARAAGRSRFELHRAFRRVTGETTKKYTSRLRVERAAAELVLGRRPVIEIALASGFASHEVFSRAFLRRFGMTPTAYRARGLVGGKARAVAAKHAAIVRDAGPCIGLYHLRDARSTPMTVDVTRRDLSPQPALIIRRDCAPTEIAATLGQILPKVFGYAQAKGIPFAGPPFTRYARMSRGTFTVEAGLPVAVAAAGEGDIEATELAGGPAAVAIHVGPYDTLGDTHSAVEAWIRAQGLEAAGPPWETYITDPGEVPDPAQWRTEVVVPLAR